jgi:hypothetical protein
MDGDEPERLPEPYDMLLHEERMIILDELTDLGLPSDLARHITVGPAGEVMIGYFELLPKGTFK